MTNSGGSAEVPGAGGLVLATGGEMMRTGGGRGHPSPKINLSPIRFRPGPSSPYAPPRTPVVTDKDLTEDDYAAVSKYFPPQRQSSPVTSTAPPQRVGSREQAVVSHAGITTPVRAKGHISSRHIPSYPHVDVKSPFATTAAVETSTPREHVWNVQDDVPFRRNGSGFSRSGTPSDADMSLCAPPSPEGLLYWSSTLNADLIDSMF